MAALGFARAPLIPQYTAPCSAEHAAYSHVPVVMTSRSGVMWACIRLYSLRIYAHGAYGICGMMRVCDNIICFFGVGFLANNCLRISFSACHFLHKGCFPIDCLTSAYLGKWDAALYVILRPRFLTCAPNMFIIRNMLGRVFT